jgi:hypothetical protein
MWLKHKYQQDKLLSEKEFSSQIKQLNFEYKSSIRNSIANRFQTLNVPLEYEHVTINQDKSGYGFTKILLNKEFISSFISFKDLK